jgi:hypothetical protein
MSPGLGGAEAKSHALSAAEKITVWNRLLLQELLPVLQEPHLPVVLACDDETLRVAGEQLGHGASEAATAFARDVKIAFNVGRLSGFRSGVHAPYDTLRRPRPLPMFFALLCLWVLAASRMGVDEKYPTSEYYGRLNGLLELSGHDQLPGFEFIQVLFQRFAEWLAEDLRGERGRLILPENPYPPWVGLAVSQTVFRARDRQVLSQFFSERLRTLDGFDPLRRLRRWSGRHQLTYHALRLLDADQAEERVRAGIRAAFQAWDGAELVATPSGFGRLWPAIMHLLPHPMPRLHLGAGNTKALEFEFDGHSVVLEPGAEVEIPWALIERLRQSPLQLGDARASSGGLRLPQLGDTIVFELGEEGLLRVEKPSVETVWVLTRDGVLQEQLARRRLNDRDLLPEWWELFHEVPLAELPSIERAAAPQAQEPLRLTGGLPLGRSLYLSGFAPLLEAGELDLDEGELLPVWVNDERVGLIGTGERLPLRAQEPGTYRVLVGDGDFTVTYDVESAGERTGGGSLCHRLDDVNALRSGARPRGTGNDVSTICGAAVSTAYEGELPILTRSATALATIDCGGELAIHDRLPTPAWFAEVGFDEGGRWDIFRADVVWLISSRPQSGRPWVRRLEERALERLSLEAAQFVAAVGAEAALSTRIGDVGEAKRGWAALVELAGRSA